MKRTVHNYSIQENNTGYEVEIHTKKGTRASEIIVMIEVSKSTILGAFFGKAKYFIVSPNGTVRDAADDEFF